ncbi:MAG: hypothetical protein APG12_00071 [Candidatus Methanofastidiosum methylothiophilum]|uniref:Uncharacterized protein n=1 Tax=Candidatus Methanofastidiosum methylothiophilum TaxID=1705564 RepID=A0A150IUS3_9EURY|nr:MAG: hypothetical protein APG10_00231 [Candidatus Methanofastidiosum methylthiophilus]KYC48761.1 MAG: hypothetical protein APG11_00072 [Candidatus Methanofastidiosum methylthiophilus]KYC51409.1 MAG: hypothetical protein APG12_00071 [Candidatus Methanofastidiosum methylthiophilus]
MTYVEIQKNNFETTALQSLLQRIEILEKELEELKKSSELIVEDKGAKLIIQGIIQSLKSKDIKEIDVIDLHTKSNLPLIQISKIMEELETEGMVKEIE